MYLDIGKLDHFLTFTQVHIQDLPFGEKILKLSSSEQIRIPNVVRTLIPSQPDSQGLHLRYPRYGEDPDTGWSRGTQILGA